MHCHADIFERLWKFTADELQGLCFTLIDIPSLRNL